jgi:glycosyltransferase involved in cell wall biosynthesis
MTPLISVIIPCFNQAHFLSDCIASLQAQSYPHWEAIIVNDGSPDDTREVALKLQEREPRLRYIEQENRGLSGARNSGISESRGAYLQFLDSDDTLEPDKLRYQIEFLEQRPEIGIVFGDARYFRTEAPLERTLGPYVGADGEPWIPKLWKAKGSLLSKLARHNLMAVNCPLVRRDVIERLGPWNETLCALEDWEYWVRCAAAGIVFEFTDHPGTHALVRLHQQSMTKESTRMLKAAFDFRVTSAGLFGEHDYNPNNLKIAMRAAETLGKQGRASRYRKLFSAFTYESARRETIRGYLLGHNSAIGQAGALFRRTVPWPIQRLLARIGGKVPRT